MSTKESTYNHSRIGAIRRGEEDCAIRAAWLALPKEHRQTRAPAVPNARQSVSGDARLYVPPEFQYGVRPEEVDPPKRGFICKHCKGPIPAGKSKWAEVCSPECGAACRKISQRKAQILHGMKRRDLRKERREAKRLQREAPSSPSSPVERPAGDPVEVRPAGQA